MRVLRKNLSALAAVIVLIALAVAVSIPQGARALDDKKKKIKIKLEASITHGQTPLPVHFVAQIDAGNDLDKYIYESSNEWMIEGKFVLTSRWTGGDPQSDPNLRGRPLNPEEASLYNTKHLISKTRNRAPRKKYEEGMEVLKSIEYDFRFERSGEYYVSFRMRNGKYRSNVVKILVKGDTTYDPMRDPY